MASETSKIWLDLFTNLQMVIDQVEGILMKIIYPNTCISYLHFYSLDRSRSTLVMQFRDCTIFCMQQVLVFVKYYGSTFMDGASEILQVEYYSNGLFFFIMNSE